MLVSSIAKFDAINQMQRAAFGTIQASNSQINSAANQNSFGGEHDLAMLNKMDKKLSLDLLTNKLTYQIAYLQEKMTTKQQNNDKTTFSALA